MIKGPLAMLVATGLGPYPHMMQVHFLAWHHTGPTGSLVDPI